MDNFRLIYKILTVYKEALWVEDLSPEALMPEKFGTTEAHVRNILLVLRNEGLIIGTNGQTVITLAGLEYLEADKRMQSIAGERKPYKY